ncbi:MAG TPA: hypothetical protein PLY23_08765 [Alphaproteobacteria bacterium]|nr:hypothetical protein [Alphaproteobacteria bacterium]HQS94722.1 hypothetical protein [Alphaproteobacteria bacterium]
MKSLRNIQKKSWFETSIDAACCVLELSHSMGQELFRFPLFVEEAQRHLKFLQNIQETGSLKSRIDAAGVLLAWGKLSQEEKNPLLFFLKTIFQKKDASLDERVYSAHSLSFYADSETRELALNFMFSIVRESPTRYLDCSHTVFHQSSSQKKSHLFVKFKKIAENIDFLPKDRLEAAAFLISFHREIPEHIALGNEVIFSLLRTHPEIFKDSYSINGIIYDILSSGNDAQKDLACEVMMSAARHSEDFPNSLMDGAHILLSRNTTQKFKNEGYEVISSLVRSHPHLFRDPYEMGRMRYAISNSLFNGSALIQEGLCSTVLLLANDISTSSFERLRAARAIFLNETAPKFRNASYEIVLSVLTNHPQLFQNPEMLDRYVSSIFTAGTKDQKVQAYEGLMGMAENPETSSETLAKILDRIDLYGNIPHRFLIQVNAPLSQRQALYRVLVTFEDCIRRISSSKGQELITTLLENPSHKWTTIAQKFLLPYYPMNGGFVMPENECSNLLLFAQDPAVASLDRLMAARIIYSNFALPHFKNSAREIVLSFLESHPTLFQNPEMLGKYAPHVLNSGTQDQKERAGNALMLMGENPATSAETLAKIIQIIDLHGDSHQCLRILILVNAPQGQRQALLQALAAFEPVIMSFMPSPIRKGLITTLVASPQQAWANVIQQHLLPYQPVQALPQLTEGELRARAGG